MLKLTALLCAFMFVTLLVGGRDYGQMRPGLAKAALEGETRSDAPLEAIAPQLAPATPRVIAASFTPAAPTEIDVPLVLPLVQTAVEPSPEAVPVTQPETSLQIWYIDARSVNVREGPSTDHPVVGKLTKGEATRVLWTETNGWARILIEGDGIEGFVSTDFLTSTAPGN